jgi:hypothetical protein
MPREAFLRKRDAPVRSLDRATAKGHTAAAETIVSENLSFGRTAPLRVEHLSFC